MTEPTKPKRKYNRRTVPTEHQTPEARNERTRKREAEIVAKAKEFGFKSKSDMLTAIINGTAIVTKI